MSEQNLLWGNVSEAMPESIGQNQLLDPLAQAVVGAVTLPKRAMDASQRMIETGRYDPAPILEAAMLPMGTGAIAGLPLRAGEVALGAGPIRAYHGSPHNFERFDMSKIGSGEGAQAYGHGLYFAENPSVAKSYRDTLADDVRIGGQKYDMYNPLHAATAQVEESGSRTQAIKDIKAAIDRDPGDPSGHFPKILRILESDKELPAFQSSGKMYEVGINADPEHFLDWDKPLSEQHPTVRSALERHEPGITEEGRTIKSLLPIEPQVSAKLNQAGIPGVKYLDQGSRGAGEGSRNYVVFDDKIVDIIKKYGLAGISMLPPATAAFLSERIRPVDHDPFGPLVPVDHDPFAGGKS